MEAMNGVTVEAKSASGIKIGTDWYGSFKGTGIKGIEAGDVVNFLWEFDKTGKYRNIKGNVSKVGTSPGGASRPSTAAKPAYSSVGVEVGHAANLAIQIIAKKSYMTDPEMYEDFVEKMDSFYKIMKEYRHRVETGTVPVAEEKLVVVKETPF